MNGDSVYVTEETPFLSDEEKGRISERIVNRGTKKKEKNQFIDKGCSITFSDLSCSIPPSKLSIFTSYLLGRSAPSSTPIIRHISGYISPGHSLAIIGPSGSGKSSLLDLLSKRKTLGTITGDLYLNNSPNYTSATLKHFSSYVTQDDVLPSSFTVEECLMFSAYLRLPSTLSFAAKREIVEEILHDLNLTTVRNSKIGNAFFRGISGGEKRRVSIGIELVTDPKLLFLDEPTSGLDSHSAIQIVNLINKLCNEKGKSIVYSIHQPSSKIFNSFEKLLVLSKGGKMIYFGDANQLNKYLKKNVNVKIPSSYNPADFVLDMISETNLDNEDAFLDLPKQLDTQNTRFEEQFKQSHHFEDLNKQIREINGSSSLDTHIQLDSKNQKSNNSPNNDHLKSDYGTGPFLQFFIMVWRNLLEIVRNPYLILLNFASYLFSAVLISLLFSKLTTNRYNQLTLCIGFLLDVPGIQSFFAVPRFIVERGIYNREKSSGTYRTSVYLLSNLLVNLPINLGISFVYSVIIYFWLELGQQSIQYFAFFLLINYLVMEVYISICQFIGTLFKDSIEICLSLAGLWLLLSIMFAGIMVQYENMPVYMRWGYWSSPMMYGLSALMINQFDNDAEGKEWLDSFGLQVHDEWLCVYVLLGAAVVGRLLCYLSLRFGQMEHK